MTDLELDVAIADAQELVLNLTGLPFPGFGTMMREFGTDIELLVMVRSV